MQQKSTGTGCLNKIGERFTLSSFVVTVISSSMNDAYFRCQRSLISNVSIGYRHSTCVFICGIQKFPKPSLQ